MKTVKKVGYKPGVYGVFENNVATGQTGSWREMRAITRGYTHSPVHQVRRRGRMLVWSILSAGIGAAVFLGVVLVMGK